MSEIIVDSKQDKPQKEIKPPDVKPRNNPIYDVDRFLNEIKYSHKSDRLKNYFKNLVKLEKATTKDEYQKLWDSKVLNKPEKEKK